MNKLQRKDGKNVPRMDVIYGHGLVSLAPLAAQAPEVPPSRTGSPQRLAGHPIAVLV